MKIGIFPIGIDGMFLREHLPEVEFLYLVPVNTPEEAWSRKFIGDNKLIRFEHGSADFTFHSVDALIKETGLTRAIIDNNIEAIFLSGGKYTKELLEWSQKSGVKIISTGFTHRSEFENKIWFDKFLTSNKLPKPKSEYVKFSEIGKISLDGKIVVQIPDSSGSEGTFFLENKSETDAIPASRKPDLEEEVLVREFTPGKAAGISVFITSSQVVLSGIRIQCTYDSLNPEKLYAGLQWVPSELISKRLRSNINQTFLELGRKMQSIGYLGYANFDFIFDANDDIWIIECNPRLSAATAQVIAFPELTSGVLTGEEFVAAFIEPRSRANEEVSDLPEYDFEGSVLNLYSKVAGSGSAKREILSSGLYKFVDSKIQYITPDIRKLSSEKNSFIFISNVSKVIAYEVPTQFAQIISNFPLYDQAGKLNKNGIEIIGYFS